MYPENITVATNVPEEVDPWAKLRFSPDELVFLGAINISLCVFFIVPYLVVLKVFIKIKEFNRHVSYNIMVHLGIMDLLQLVCYILMGIQMITNTTFGHVLDKFAGALSMSSWVGMAAMTLILAINRLFILADIGIYFGKFFNTEIMYKILLIISYLFVVLNLVIMLLPEFGFVLHITYYDYERLALEINLLELQTNILFGILGVSCGLYLITIIYLIVKRNFMTTNTRIIENYEIRLFFQTMFICVYKTSVNALTAYWIPPSKLVYVLVYCIYLMESGYNPYMYFFTNSIISACLPSATNDEATVPITEGTTTASSGTTAASSGTTTASSGITTASSGTTIALSGTTSTVATTTTTSNPFAGCQFNTLTDAQRDTVAQIHNNFRSMLANGLAVQPNGNLQPGKNIYKLKYNCALENMAQVIANNCTFTVFRSDYPNCMVNTCSSQNNFGSTGVNEYTTKAIESTDAALQSATSAWWDQLRTNGNINSANPVFFIDSFTIFGGITGFGPPLYDFAQMAWADTITVGCGVGHCAANPTLVVCYYATGGSIQGNNIYQVGAPCSGCTTFAGSTCDSALGLCVAPDANYQNPF